MFIAKAIDVTIFSVDFEDSMGKTDPYYSNFFNIFESYLRRRPGNPFFRYLRPYNPNELYSLCKKLFDDNIINIASSSQTYRIPPIFHQIWVGTNPFPERYKVWQKTWQNIEGWDYKLWTDEDVEEFVFINKELYYNEKNFGARADIFLIVI